MGFWEWFAGTSPAAIAGETASQTVGTVFTGLKNIIAQFTIAPEEKLKLEILIEQQRLEFYKAQTSDVQNARQMQMTTRSVWPGLISSMMLVGFFVGGGYTLIYGLPPNLDTDSRMIITLFVQTLIGGVTLVLGYWLGTSYGSQNKDHMLFNSVPAHGSTEK